MHVQYLYPMHICIAHICCVFGHVGLCMYILAVWGLTAGKSPVSVIYCLLIEVNGQKR